MSGPVVTVRMYRGILGDCFLLTVAAEAGAPRARRSHVLIDCGVLQGVEGAATRMRQVVDNIRDVTEGRLDCVVVTHEHFDHISGFKYAEQAFAGMTIDCLWLAWTEDPVDPKGQELQERFAAAHQKFAALQLARLKLGVAKPKPDLVEDEKRVMGLGGFNAPLASAELDVLAAGAAPRGSKRIYAKLREWAGTIDYLRPGDVVQTPAGEGAPSLRAYVLGPPYEDKYLFKALPSKGEAKETYLLGVDAAKGADQASAHSPFAPHYRWYKVPPPRDAGDVGEAGADAPDLVNDPGARAFVRRHYDDDVRRCRHHDLAEKLRNSGDELPAWLRHHDCKLDFVCRHRQDYRRIDDLLDVEQSALALKMDSNTNNTSLVLAFELGDEPGEGATLLFAADAQVGNWKSWEEVKYWKKGHERNDALQVKVTSADLLGRARLYKVGHHGSHNATLKAKGLELMVDQQLVAMIPTVEDIALEQGSNGWQMPNPETYKGLIRQTRGRILRGDRFWTRRDGQAEGLREQIAALVRAENKRIDEQRLNEPPIEFDEHFAPADEQELYVDLRIEC